MTTSKYINNTHSRRFIVQVAVVLAYVVVLFQWTFSGYGSCREKLIIVPKILLKFLAFGAHAVMLRLNVELYHYSCSKYFSFECHFYHFSMHVYLSYFWVGYISLKHKITK